MTKFKLNISEKNFIYNLVLTLVICGLIFSYMAFYMPQVYMEKKMENIEAEAFKIHEYFLDHKSYEGLDSKPKEGMYSFFLPKDDDKILISSLHFNLKGKLKSEDLKDFLAYAENLKMEDFNKEEFIKNLSPIINNLKKDLGAYIDLEDLKKIPLDSADNTIIRKKDSGVEIKFESRTKDSVATNLIIFSKTSEGSFILAYPFISNSIGDIKTTVFAAFPVIFLLVIIIVFVLNKFYSRTLTEPIIKISNFTKRSKYDKEAEYDLEISTNDEIEELSNNLKDLYESLTKNYKDLEKSSKQREIFIKSTSHQLKTPLQGAILLNESMINKIGKYEDRDKYLPELRKKLFEIQVLIEDLLFMNKIDQEPIFEDLNLALILKESINNHSDLIIEKNLEVEVLGSMVDRVDYDHFRIIFDNLIKNAIENTESGGKISCTFLESIKIENFPTHLEEKNLERFLEPFVSGKKEKSNGLGLYIAKALLEDMNYSINISYTDEKFLVEMKKFM